MRLMFRFLVLLLVVATPAVAELTGLPSPSGAGSVPANFSASLVANTIANPTAMQFAPDGRLFV